jgi:hypothetical protein
MGERSSLTILQRAQRAENRAWEKLRAMEARRRTSEQAEEDYKMTVADWLAATSYTAKRRVASATLLRTDV